MLEVIVGSGETPGPGQSQETDATDRRGRPMTAVTRGEYRRLGPPANKGRRYPPEPLSAEEVYAMLDACTGRGAVRNRALIYCLWRSGLRIAEALALYPKDVDLDGGRIAVLHGKGDKRRIVALDAEACGELERWAEARAELGVGAGEPFFCVMTAPTVGLELSPTYVRELLRRLGRAAGIRKRVHPHGLRHTYAAYLLEQGVSLPYISKMLGHARLSITERYCDHLNPFEAVERVRAVSWPERKAA